MLAWKYTNKTVGYQFVRKVDQILKKPLKAMTNLAY